MKPASVDLSDYRGKFIEQVPLGDESWFACGGKADLVFHPADVDDLAVFLKEYNGDVLVLGGLANTIVRDGGIRGCVVQLGKPFADIEIQGNRILAGAGTLNGSVAAAAAKAGIGGLEFLSGIPGTVGGAIAMNAGAYGTEVKDVFAGAIALERGGKTVMYGKGELKMSYRHTEFPEGMIFTGAVFQGKEEDRDLVRERLKSIKVQRQETQPIAEKTGGSTFANPKAEELVKAGLKEGTRAWEVVEKVGGRGLKIGGAQMSEKHCNFMINTGNSTAGDLERLGDELVKRVLEQFRLELRWEIKRVGDR